MKRISYRSMSLLLLLLLLAVSTRTLISVNGTGWFCGSANYGMNLSSDPQAEKNEAIWACGNITWLFEKQRMWYWWWLTPVYDHCNNYYGSQTTEAKVASEASHFEEEHFLATTFYYGHALYSESGGRTHYYFYPYGGYPPGIDDYSEVYPNTLDVHQFVFLWACGQGNEIGGFDSNNYAAGMPFAWTHRDVNGLSDDGYEDPWSSNGDYCFIGFENNSKPLSEGTGTFYGGDEYIYRYWLVHFYYYVLETYSNVNEALDLASNVVWGETFDNTPLYQGYLGPDMQGYYTMQCKMHVYGDGTLDLPKGAED